MTTIWTPRGAAGRFDRAVETSGDAVSGSPTDPARAELLALVDAIRSLPEVTPRAEHVADLRSRLMAEADRMAAARGPVAAPASPDEDRLRLRPARAHRGRRTTVVIGALTALGVSTTVGVAAQTALPGDPLYGVKRALETARTQVALTETSRGAVLLAHATDRLAETSAVLGGTDAEGTAALSATLDSFSAEAAQASRVLLAEYTRTGDRRLVEDLRTFTAASRTALDDMQDAMPASGVDAWTRATEVVEAIDTDALAACPLCSADLGALAAAVPTTPDFGADRTAPSDDRSPSADPSRPEGRDPDDSQRRGPSDRGTGDTVEPDVVPDPGSDAGDDQPTASPSPSPDPTPRDPGGGADVNLKNPLKGLGDRLDEGLLGGGGSGDRRGLGGLDDLIP